MLHLIKKVKHIENYKLELLFNDGKVKIVDFENRLKEAKNMFLPLKDIEYFKKVESDGTTIMWPNGLDLCPDVLYEKGVEIKQFKQPQRKNRPKQPTSMRKSRIVKL